MKKLQLFLIIILATVSTAYAQLTGMNPNHANLGQNIVVKIAAANYPFTDSGGRSNVYFVELINGTDSLTAITDSVIPFGANRSDTLLAYFNIPPSQPPGLYDLIVYTYNGAYTLPNAFNIGNVAVGTITGNVYSDLNQNGVKDAGEPGIQGYKVQLSSSTAYAYTDAAGNYSIVALVGTDTINVRTAADDVYINTTPDSIVLNVALGTNPGNNFGLKAKRFLISVTPNRDTAGIRVHFVITDSMVTKNATIQNVALHFPGTGVIYYADSTSVPDSTHINASFRIPSYLTPTGKYDLVVTTRSQLTNSVWSYRLDTSVTIIGPVSIINGYAYQDTNHNGSMDAGEPIIAGETIILNGSYTTTTDSNGHYSFNGLSNGSYTVTAYVNGYSCNGQPTQVIEPSAGYTITINNDSALNNNFGIYTATGVAEYNLFIHPGWQPANPGFSRHYWIFYGNLNRVPAAGAVVTFQYDPILTFDSCDRVPTSNDLVNHILTWNVDSVFYTPNGPGGCRLCGTGPVPTAPGYWDGGWNNFNLYMHVPVSASPGSYIHSVFTIGPTGNDCDPRDNIVVDSTPITSSHDPNEKHGNPYSTLIHGVDSTIEYTINFQNTGTAPTHFIIVNDTLDSNLDPKSIKVTGASLPYVMTNNNGALSFTFNPGVLADSADDERNSNGSISFLATLKSGLPVGTVIKNTARIYFDYNDAVATNTTTHTTVYVEGIINITSGQQVVAGPNPFDESTTIHFVNANFDRYTFTLYDMIGNVIQNMETTGGDFTVLRQQLPAGVYVFKLVNQNTKQSAQGKLIAQ